MTVAWAQAILDLVAAYLAFGAVFALAFLAVGLRRLDPAAASGSVGFKLLIAPGILVLWPVVLILWLFGAARRET